MCKFKREGSGGMVPTAYKIPTLAKIEEIKRVMFLSNNNSLGKKNIENKEKKILEIFDKAENKIESKSSIAEKVSIFLGVPCNRKLVRRVLNEKRSSKLNKLR
jgi:type I site-specific restriction endonuclease